MMAYSFTLGLRQLCEVLIGRTPNKNGFPPYRNCQFGQNSPALGNSLGMLEVQVEWLAVQELKLDYHNLESMVFDLYPYSGN